MDASHATVHLIIIIIITVRQVIYNTDSHYLSSYSVSPDNCLFALSTAPGLGYGRCWNKGPDAVTSAPVLAVPRRSSPVVHEPRGVSEYEAGSIGSSSSCSRPRDRPENNILFKTFFQTKQVNRILYTRYRSSDQNLLYFEKRHVPVIKPWI